jgi:hypothetical protein
MDGRLITVLFALVLPGILIGVTAVYFALNPLSILACIGVMVGGSLYLLSYTGSFGPSSTAS